MLKSITFKRAVFIIALILFQFFIYKLSAQTASTSDNLVAQPTVDRKVPFNVTATGIQKTFEFGLDTAWDWDINFIRGARFMTKDQVDCARVSFQPEQDDLVNGDLAQSQIDKLNWRLSIVANNANPGRKIVMNVAAENVNTGPYYQNPQKWSDLVKATAIRIENDGHTVVSVGPMNEPDYSTHQGDIDDFYDITTAMRNDPYFDNIRISAGNTLNNDVAQQWYDYMLPAGANEGNTHQLAGSFDTYASFYQNVTANGHFAANDELHNVMEALVGYEYGAQMGIWWGAAELARGELATAVDGQRLGYAEHRPNWSAAAIYRRPDGKIQAYAGASERQAITTTYNYISKDRVVYYDGQGPFREFVLTMPGGDGYWVNQPSGESVINITYGEDIQPAVNGRYILVNRNSGLAMTVDGNVNLDGTNVAQQTYTGATSQQWDVTPVDNRIGGDFSYYRIKPASNGSQSLNVSGADLNNGGNIQQWSMGDSAEYQWYLEYAEDGWFYIRSRRSAYCLAVSGASTAGGANVLQWEKQAGNEFQWRILPVGAPIEFDAPSAPTNLIATTQDASIKLNWTANPEVDVAGYIILRAESAGGAYNTIARNVSVTSFVDNTALTGVQYFYKIKAVDGSLNRSAYSNEVSATATGANTIVQQLDFENNLADTSVNLNHTAIYGTATYGTGKVGTNALTLNGSDNFVQLPADIANHQEITVATWVKWGGGNAWQRVFDFGNGQEESMYLTTNNWSGNLEFNIYNAGGNNVLSGPAIAPNAWTHVAVTLGASEMVLYVNGQAVAQTAAPAINPLTIKPVQNYIGRSQWPDALLNGSVDDFRVYNYPLSAQEVADLAGVAANTPPTVSITSPTDGANFDEGTIVTVTADASDADGLVSQVEFFVDGVSIGVDTTSPYEMNWTVGAGSFALTAVATDNELATTASIGINVTGTCASSTITPYYNVNWSGWVIGTDITVNEGDLVILGPQPLTGGSWSWNGCATSGTSREQQITMSSSCVATATHTNDCGGVSNATYNITVVPASSAYMAVQSIATGTANAGKGKKYGTTTVTIVDNQSNPVSGATVYGTFSGTFGESVSGTTDGNGAVYFQTSVTAGGSVSVDFCVDDATHSSLTYNSGQNQITCTGSSAKSSKSKIESSSVENTEFKLYPNPTSQYITITLGMELVEMNLVDINGRLVQTKMAKIGDKQYQLDMSNLTSGVYLLMLKTSESHITKKVIKL